MLTAGWSSWRGRGVDMAWTLECKSELTGEVQGPGGPLRPVMGIQGEAGEESSLGQCTEQQWHRSEGH